MKRSFAIAATLCVMLIPVLFLWVKGNGAHSQEDGQEGGVVIETADGEVIEAVQTESDPLVLFVSEGCGHCAKVEAFIEEYSLQDQIEIKDTSVDDGAAEEYTEQLDSFEVPLEERGVPLLIYGGDQYVIGDAPIISYLEGRFGIEQVEEETEPRDYSTGDYVLLGAGIAVVAVVVGYGIVKSINGDRD